ncbi:MAG TPA: hypothetical protein VGF95_01585 [Solirubrobacteraceae bacterium]|jgi:hypothetical protein
MHTSHSARLGDGRRKRLFPAIASLVTVAICLLAAGASAASTLPVSPTDLGSSTAYKGLQVEPATIVYTGDGTGLLGGANVDSRKSGISWTQWTASTAIGTGFNQLNNCRPSCAGGKYRGYRVKIELWRPQTLASILVFTRMTIFYEEKPPRGEPHHYTFTDTYTRNAFGGGYGWGPPDANGYCTHTHGMKQAAGCQNIHSLP